jgi:hypothetical protein
MFTCCWNASLLRIPIAVTGMGRKSLRAFVCWSVGNWSIDGEMVETFPWSSHGKKGAKDARLM